MKKQLVNIISFSKLTSINNFLHLSLNQGTNVLVALIITPYLFQTLGEEEYGMVNLGLTVIMLFSILVNYGFHLNGPKRISLMRSNVLEKSALINEVIFTRLFISTTLLIVVFTLVELGLFRDYGIILLFSTVLLVNEAVFPMFILQGLDRISWISKANAFSKLLYLVFVLIIVQSKSDAKWVNLLFGGTSLLVNVVLLRYIYRIESIKLVWVKPRAILYRFTENFQFFISTIAGHISIYGGLVILTNFVSDFELGQYSLAQRVAFLLRMIPVFIMQSILQNATRLYDKGEDDFRQYLKKAYRGGLLLTFVLGAAVAISAPLVIRIVGGEYIEYSENLLRILAFIPFLSTLNVSNMIRILVAERKDIMAKATWITALFMVITSVVGSFYFGGYGLAVALLLTELVSYIAHSLFLKAKQE